MIQNSRYSYYQLFRKRKFLCCTSSFEINCTLILESYFVLLVFPFKYYYFFVFYRHYYHAESRGGAGYKMIFFLFLLFLHTRSHKRHYWLIINLGIYKKFSFSSIANTAFLLLLFFYFICVYRISVPPFCVIFIEKLHTFIVPSRHTVIIIM